ncbi:BRISC and BRCA1-A complex member 1-like [Battus philenor]|uniref:BRISC and BRCA1-A complex member 1-like n=1 Tax=Battus philenor TaxID=42288 RepID=UPI0035CF19C1
MDSRDILSSCNPNITDMNDTINLRQHSRTREDYTELRDQAIKSFQKPNLPNVNVPEKIIICLDICYDNENSLYRLADGTTFTPVNMLKRIVDFFIHSKNAINKRTEFALLVLKDNEPSWLQNFTSNLKDIIGVIDYLNAEESTSEIFDFQKIFHILKNEVLVPEYSQADCILPPPYVVRMIVLYGRSNCMPQIPQDDPYLIYLKKQFYFYIDILLAHEEDCALYKCEEIYDALQDLDNGYSYVYEVSRNATKIHDCIAKLLAHPLQRPLQKNTDYSFGCRY